MYFLRLMLVVSCAWAETLPVPLGLDAYVPAPASNPLTREKVLVGRALFFFQGLSADRSLSCAGCHLPERGFTDGKARALGVGGQVGPRRTPPLLNRAWGKSFFWDGRAPTLEDQVLQPIVNPAEMALKPEQIAVRVREDAELSARMKAVFGREACNEDVARALASYVRTIFSGDSAYDRFVAGDRSALTDEEQLGLRLFRGKAGCVSCHLGPNLTDEGLHNTGLGEGALKTPGLREVGRTSPYMHDGSLGSLEEVVEFYNGGGKANPGIDPEMRELGLTVGEKRALVRFLRTLSGVVREGWP